MRFIRFVLTMLGLWVSALALLGLVLDGVRSIAANQIVMKSLGETWFEVNPASLNLAQAAIQRNVHPLLWDPVLQWVLTLPAWIVAAVLGLSLIYAGRKRRPKVIRI